MFFKELFVCLENDIENQDLSFSCIHWPWSVAASRLSLQRDLGNINTYVKPGTILFLSVFYMSDTILGTYYFSFHLVLMEAL